MKTIAVAALLLNVVAAAEEPYFWPLNLPRQLSSSFAEYRPGRFHAGIDLRTGAIGKAVFAAGEGYVERIRSSPHGYGNAIYLKLNDGNIVVYGHLDTFEEPLADYVRQAQHSNESIEVDLYPDAGQFPITKGQLIAHSGNTGIGYPHLHYEWRDDANRPINPRLLGVTWPDTTRPTPRNVALVPHGPGSFVQNDLLPLVIDVPQKKTGEYKLDPVRVWGTVGVAVDVVDPADGNKLGVWRIVTSLDGQEIFRVQHDLYSYDNTHNAAVAYHPFLSDYGRFLVQWRWRGNTTAIYDHSPHTGWIRVPEGEHTIRVSIADFNENESVITIPVVGEPPQFEPPQGGNTRVGSVALQCWGEWLSLTATFPASEAETPALVASGMVQDGAFYPVSSTTWRAAYRPVAGTESLKLEVQHPRLAPYQRDILVAIRDEKGRAFSTAGIDIQTSPTSPYGALFLTVDPVDVKGRTPEPPLGMAYSIGFAESPIDEPVRLSFEIPLPGVQTERVDIYRVNGNDASRVGAEREGDRFTITTRSLGTFAALEDKTPPAIKNFSSSAGVSSARPKIEASVVDNLSGIADIRLTLNGRWLLIRFDPEHNSIRWEQDHDLPSGVGDLTLTVRDHAGNSNEETRTVTIP